MYDIIFISDNFEKSNNSFEKIKKRFPIVKRASSFYEAQKKSFTKFFWIIWDDIVIEDSFNFSYIPDSGSYDYVHVFKNGNYYDGICLFPKNIKVSKREFDYRFFTNKKEIDIVASLPMPFEKYYINTYDEYLTVLEKSSTDMFWVIWDDLKVSDDFNFNYYIPYYDSFHRNITHVFRNGEFYDGICLFPKNIKVSKREFDYRFFTNKKEIDIVASLPKLYNIIFISYFEKFADSKYENLKSRFPNHNIYHVKNVKGIHNAHVEAATIATTDMFWVVDVDAIIVDTFNFIFQMPYYEKVYEKDTVYVWQSQNPINNLVYGYGGVKLLPRNLTMNMKLDSVDMTTSISNRFKSINEISNITNFNTDPFNTWKSAFRECVKLSSKTISEQIDEETEHRLKTWCTVGEDKPYGEYAIAGALTGNEYGSKYKDNLEMLSKINDWEWLEDEFKKY